MTLKNNLALHQVLLKWKIGKLNNLKVPGCAKTKGSKQDSQHLLS